jgi:hypothetical protein
MRYFTVTHQPLGWPLPGFMEPVSTVPAGDRVTDLGERYPDLAGRGPELGEYATLFAVRRLLQETWAQDGPPADGEMLGISHYRRFAVTRATGTADFVFGTVTPDVFATLPDELFTPPAGTLLVPPLVEFAASVLQFYGNNHSVRDLLHFMGIAVDLGVVSEPELAVFLTGRHMVPTPSTAVVPATWFVETLESVERVAQEFGKTVAQPRDGYQRRATGFCCERLHALLLARLLVSWPPDRIAMNRALLVSEDGTYQLGG